MFWGFRDYLCWVILYFIYSTIFESDLYSKLNILLCIPIYLSYSFIGGFVWWCIFVVGHDCGHGSFSNYYNINQFLGHIYHGSIFVPFWPWALSHNKHHLYHNHIVKDYSNPWHVKNGPGEAALDFWGVRQILPIVAWPTYLIGGFSDGTHFFPTACRLYKNSTLKSKLKCIVSSLSVFVWLYVLCIL
eukprot:UN28968